jgi:glycosyltransferase involved in cell wall biosynthesis
MAMDAPVVASSRAGQGLEARPGADLVIEDDPRRFAARAVALLRDPEARRRFGQSGRAFVERHHSRDRSLGQLDRVVEAVRAEAVGAAALGHAP